MKRNAVLGAVLLATALTTGCVDRKFVITSDPPNAAVYVNGVYKGQTPVDDTFLYYGKYEYKIVKDGFETLVDQKRISPPFYEYPPADFITDIFVPYQIRDVRRIHYVLSERVPVREEDVLERARILRERGKTLGAPAVDGPMPTAPFASNAPSLPAPAATTPAQGLPPPPPTFPAPR